MNPDFTNAKFSKSSYSNGPGGGGSSHCVMVAAEGGHIGVRDSKDSSKMTLVFTIEEWKAFVAGVKHNEFDY